MYSANILVIYIYIYIYIILFNFVKLNTLLIEKGSHKQYFNRINFRGDKFSQFSKIFPPSAKISTREKFEMMPTGKIYLRKKDDDPRFFFNFHI